MSIASRFKRWKRRRKKLRRFAKRSGSLREFVYLDDISVYSLLASRRGTIVTEFTETETVSLNSGVGASIDAGFGMGKVGLKSEIGEAKTQGSQVLHKALIQTTFKELHDLEYDSLLLRPPNANPEVEVESFDDLERLQRMGRCSGWIVDPDTLRRGVLCEIEVELGADPIFNVSSMITSMHDVIREVGQFSGSTDAQVLNQMRSVVQIIESLLAGLIPIRGTLVDYQVVRIRDRECLVHRSLLDQIPTTDDVERHPVALVGVTQHDLFWKDIRRFLFSQSRHKVFCRLTVGHVTDEWRPIKGLEVLNTIDASLSNTVQEFGDLIGKSVSAGIRTGYSEASTSTKRSRRVVVRYADALAMLHESSLDRHRLEVLIDSLVLEDGWLDSVDLRRPVLSQVKDFVDQELGVITSPEAAAKVRYETVLGDGSDVGDGFEPTGSDVQKTLLARSPRFLEAEIIAIYW